MLLGKRLQQSGAALTVLHILTSGKSQEHERIEQLIRGADANESGDAAGPQVTVRVAESTAPSDAAIREAAQGYDLMIVSVALPRSQEPRECLMRLGMKAVHDRDEQKGAVAFCV